MESTISERVKNLRKAKGLTLEELAEKALCTKSYIWEIENKPNIRPSADLVFRLAIALDTTMEHLIGEKQHSDVEDAVVLVRFKKLSPDDQSRVLKIMAALS